MVGVLASVLLHADDHADRLYPGLALVGPFALLVFVAVQSARPTVAVPIVLFVGCSAVLLSVSQPAQIGAPSEPHHSWLSSTTALTGAVVIGATLVALTLGGGGGAEGSGPGGTAVAAVPPTGLSLTSSLVALELHDANVELFRAHSTVPTYWQVAVLNVLRNGEWTTDAETASAVNGTHGSADSPSPPIGTIGPATTFTTTVDVDHFSSRLLPVPPATVAVSGPGPSMLTPLGAVSTQATEPGQKYTTTSLVPVNDPGVLAGESATSTYPPALVQAYTALPPLPSSVGLVAREATLGSQTPIGEAEALVDWFRSGRFTYSLDPPAVTPGADPIVSFLTTTRTGTCEQFAGAFTVLARTLGLPTRMVVGFTAGRRTGPDEVTIRGDDAHAWPEVYLGPTAGWVSFEPTPQKLTGEAAPEGVVGPSGVERTVPPPVTSPPSVPQVSISNCSHYCLAHHAEHRRPEWRSQCCDKAGISSILWAPVAPARPRNPVGCRTRDRGGHSPPSLVTVRPVDRWAGPARRGGGRAGVEGSWRRASALAAAVALRRGSFRTTRRLKHRTSARRSHR